MQLVNLTAGARDLTSNQEVYPQKTLGAAISKFTSLTLRKNLDFYTRTNNRNSYVREKC